MSFAKILTNVSGNTRDAMALSTSFAAAKRFNSHVAALFVHSDPTDDAPYVAEGPSLRLRQEMTNRAIEKSKIAAAYARAAWKSAAAKFGAVITEEPEKRDCMTTSFQETNGGLAEEVADAAKFADLIVFSPITDDDVELTEVLERILLKTEHAVLLPARTPVTAFGHKIAIAWDGSFAAAHALYAAMPYLVVAKEIEILCVQPAPQKPDAITQLRNYLGLHGLSFTVRTIDAEQRSIGEALLDAASESKADLLVMGGYGHSRKREALFGGVTRHVISHPEMPVYMVH